MEFYGIILTQKNNNDKIITIKVGGIIMYGEWMKNINTNITREDIIKYEENKKNDQLSTFLYIKK